MNLLQQQRDNISTLLANIIDQGNPVDFARLISLDDIPESFDTLRKVYRAIEVDFPGQPPLILRNKKEFEHDVLAGIVDDTLDCQMDERNGFSDDGTELFRVSVKVIDLYTLATLPGWEPV